MATMRLEIVTAERMVYSEDVDMLVAPGIDGQLGILPNHAPLLTAHCSPARSAWTRTAKRTSWPSAAASLKSSRTG